MSPHFPMQQTPPGQIPFGPDIENWSVLTPHMVPGLTVPVMGFEIRGRRGVCHHVQVAEFWPQILDMLKEIHRQITGGLILPPGVTMPSYNTAPDPGEEVRQDNGAPASLPAEMTDKDLDDIRRLHEGQDPTQ